MADGSRNYLEQTQDRSMLWEGRELTPDEMADELTKVSPLERLEILDRLNSDLKHKEYSSAREAARDLAYTRALNNRNEMLRKVGR